MSRKRLHTFLALGVTAVGVVLAAVVGLFLFMSQTARPLHPNPQDVPSNALSDPPPGWTGAVERARQVVIEELTGQNLPGVSVAVGVGGDVVWAEGFGWADLGYREPVRPDTRFRIGTASMALTSAGVGLLLEQDRLDLDVEIQRYVPAFPRKEWPVTLGQAMGHLAGIRPDAADEEPVWQRCDEAAEGLERFAGRPLMFEPGTRYRYSSYSWILVSAAVEAAADTPFFRFMRRAVFEPLGMNDTTAEAETEWSPDQATYYFPRFAADPRYGPQAPSAEDFTCFAGAAAYLSTPSDLVRFAMAINGGTLLQPATVQRLQEPQRLASGDETGYGLGWGLETVDMAGEETRVVGHDGELRGGNVSSFWTFPNGTVVAVASNTAFADTWSIALEIAQAFADQVSGQEP